MNVKDETILIIGGTGSLGRQLIETWVQNNTLVIYSRDECKQWHLKNEYASLLKNKKDSTSLEWVVGDIRNYSKVEQTILRYKPTIIIIAAALKHIDVCEYDLNECLETNCIGTKNVLDAIEKHEATLQDILQTVCFISTDKACSPVNVYGMAKGLSEKMMIEKSKFMSKPKFVTVRYGNVLNSRGSIIPSLHIKGKDDGVKEFTLTHPDMTRFIMTLDQAVDLITFAIKKGISGDIIIPTLKSLKILDLFEIFSEKYNKPLKITGIRPGEKMLESLINETQARTTVMMDNHYRILPLYKVEDNNLVRIPIQDYNSTINPLSKEELKQYLEELNLL